MRVAAISCAIAVPLGASGLVLANTAAPDAGSSVVAKAEADSYVDHDRPTVNFGQSRRLLVGGRSWPMSYVRFQLPAAVANQIRGARLVLTYATPPAAGATVSTALAASWWTENGVTAENGPTPGYALGRSSGKTGKDAASFDVTRAVRGKTQVTLAVWGSGPQTVFASRESGSPPRLEIQLNGEAPPIRAEESPSPSASPSPSTSPSPSVSPTPSASMSPSPSPSGSGSAQPDPACPVSDKLVPSCGAWWGVAANPLNGETWDQALSNFETEIGRSVDIAHFYKKSPEFFPSSTEIARAHDPAHPRILLINWKPQGDRTWAQVAGGAVDAYIDQEASYLKKNFTDRFFLALHHEPEMDVNPTAGSGMTAKDYAAMFRHVVERLRADGVTNAVFVLNYLGTPDWGSQPWFNDLYPGDDVVDWIAEDPYVIRGSDPWWTTTFGAAVDRKESGHPQWPGFYSWAKQYHPDRPIMLAEWGVDEQPSDPDGKADFFLNQIGGMQQYPNIKALVYWNSVPFHPVGITRVDSSQPALDAYRKLSDIPFLNQPGT
ncbi:DUF7594 domain-containing protein [Fodinicola acaciae]|uniref:CBM96 family carbohydrate-binding protein n=1 Tax=Fodinicola acaciae TaxID=2681555 RepID=UPI0013D6799F|nr:DNRLRE domain-containing protein [Fodinicola acaciae]